MDQQLVDITPKQNEVRIGCLNGRIVVLYEKPVDHVEMTPGEAMQFVNVLLEKINHLNHDVRLAGV